MAIRALCDPHSDMTKLTLKPLICRLGLYYSSFKVLLVDSFGHKNNFLLGCIFPSCRPYENA